MSQTKPITYAFRRPRCPLICAVGRDLIGAKSLASFERQLARFDLSPPVEFRLIDANGEGWMLLPDKMIVGPCFAIRRWRKADIIRLFNESRGAKEGGLRYPESLIPSRRLDAIVNDLAALLSRSPGAMRGDSDKTRA